MEGKRSNLAVIACFLLFIYALFFVNLFKSSDELSFSERRRLAQFPELNAETLLNADFMKGFDEYASDQIAFRDRWRSLKAYFDLNVLGKYDNNAIFVVGDMVFKTDYPINHGSVRRLCGIINYCDEQFLEGLSVYYAVIPDKNYYLPDSPQLIMDYNELIDLIKENLKDNMEYIDLFGALSLESYFLTDSHWRQDELSGVVAAISDGIGVGIPFDAANYTPKTHAPFYGVFYGQAALHVRPDELVYLVSETTENAVVRSLEKPGETLKVYDETALGGMDAYNLFMTGPAAVVTVDNPSGPVGRGLVIFRDSYASSLAPLLLEGYSTITLIDLRYIRPDLLKNSELVGEYVDFAGKDVLFMLSSTIFNSSDSVQSAPVEDFVSPFVARYRLS